MFITCFISCNRQKNNVIGLNKIVNQDKNPLVTKVVITALDSIKLGINFKANGNYTLLKSRISEDKSYFKSLYTTDSRKALDSASNYLYDKLINVLTPHWYGTTWDFNGYTNTPNDGLIACGYFVSTTLKHLDFKVNRYKMAQQAGLHEAIALQPKSQLKTYSNLTFDALKDKLNQVYNDGIYFVGLDNHVGYVLIKDKELYFLHSSYCDDKVVIELAETSPCFQSNLYVFAEITTNANLIKKWIFSETLVIPKT
ncbi:hypothetical protein [Psychroserpens sp. NJDZ02]|uniref:hypothetical protein n=1 Tax=Psychroserpens sp. NJDZ02 TaxID=2570561 RepID=UPI0010A92F44|nr:hypothetical protein [Psychroserpens sp. NJDZ02]QCE40930.1 hypothetical protein E9099_05690 [Psychroserpens sp. NJDZ02]